MHNPDHDADFAILTILQEAYDSVKRIFRLSDFSERLGYQWTYGTIPLNDGTHLRLALGRTLDRDNIPAATFTSKMIEAWKPINLLLVDIGGAVEGRDNVQLGDVVTHTTLHYYDHHKVVGRGRHSPRYIPFAPASTHLRELSRRPADRADQSWIDRIEVRRPIEGIPRVLPGEMLVGGAIQANSPRLKKLLLQYPKALAVETEGAGTARAVLDSDLVMRVPNFLIVRGVSDFCNVPQEDNQTTRDAWRAYAAESAAAHAYSLILETRGSPRSGDEPETIDNLTRFREPLNPDSLVQYRTLRFAPPLNAIDNLWEAQRSKIKGRDLELTKLRSRFIEETSSREVRLPYVISGEAGVGKSALAREIAEEVASFYAARWWIDASDQFKVRTGLREFARRLNIPSAHLDLGESNDTDFETHRFLSDLRQALEERVVGGRVLFILDNVDEPTLKHNLPLSTLRYLPPTDCDVLITSQSSKWSPVAPTGTLLKGLDSEAGARMIAEEIGRPDLFDDDDLQGICEDFGGRPLFLHQIASLLRDGESPREFRRHMNDSLEYALGLLPEVEGFTPLWSVVYRMSIDRAEGARPGARGLLQTMAFLAPDPIPLELLRATARGKTDHKGSVADAVLVTLADRSLVECLRQHGSGTRTFLLHRVIAALVRLDVNRANDASRHISMAISAITLVMPDRNQLRCSEGRQRMAILAPHVESLTSHLLTLENDHFANSIRARAADACSLLGLYHRTLSEWVAAQAAHERSVELSDTNQEPGSAALRSVRLANVMRQRGHFKIAQDHLDSVIGLLKLHGDPRDYAWALTVQARILRARPDSSTVDALPLLAEAGRILKPFEHDGNPSTKRQISELHGYSSVMNRLLSKFDVAEREATEGLRTISGLSPDEALDAIETPNEPLVATHLRALGGVWRLLGNFSRAMLAHQRALAIFEGVYGPNHTDVGRALDSLGRVQRECGDFDGAIASFNRAERISDTQFGLNYPHAGTASVNRALVYLDMNMPHAALIEADRGIGIYRQAYNENFDLEKGGSLRNDSTVWALFVRANALMELGELETARAHHEVVLEWRQHRYPRIHAHIASSHYALGDVLWGTRDASLQQLGLRHHREALSIREHIFKHQPDYWLAQSQSRLGWLSGDGELMGRAYETFRAQLGLNHWRTRQVANYINDLKS